MREVFQRITALVLVLCLLGPLCVSAAQVTEDGHVILYPERLEEFEFPANWSANALKFCVGNGIMNGRGKDLAANSKTTRAETAAMIIRLLGAKSENPDLSRFADANPDAWYYAELAAAVELGIMNGVSDTMLAPNAAITREQVFTLLSRAFGLYPQDGDYWRQFSDGYSCSNFAKDAVSALAERGIISGYTDGSLKPKQSITRAELAQLLYNLFTCVCDSPDDLPGTGRVLYRGTEPIPEGYTLDGDLTIGCGYAGEQTLTGVNITGNLTLRPGLESSVTFDACQANSLTIPAVMTVSGEIITEEIVSKGKGSVICMSADTVRALSDCTIEGDVNHLVCQGSDMTVTLNAVAQVCTVNGKNVTVIGSGSALRMEINASGSDIQVPVEVWQEDPRMDPDNALTTVTTLEVWDVVTKDTSLYSSSNLTGFIRSLPVGTKLDHLYYTEGDRAAQVYTEDGVHGWVDINCIEIPTETVIEEAYTPEVMEAYVNQKGYSSSTDYLIWVSLKTQTVNVFKGSKGEWSLIRSMPCSSGKNSTPTIRGEFSLRVYYWEWVFANYKVKYATTFCGNYAFHSRIWSSDYSVLLDDTIGTPASDGCVRMLDEDCYYIFDKMPYGTRVVVY